MDVTLHFLSLMDYSIFCVSTERYKGKGNLIKMFNDKDFKCLLSALSTFEWNSFHSPHPFAEPTRKTSDGN